MPQLNKRIRIVDVPSYRAVITSREAGHYFQVMNAFELGKVYELPINLADALLSGGNALEDKAVEMKERKEVKRSANRTKTTRSASESGSDRGSGKKSRAN